MKSVTKKLLNKLTNEIDENIKTFNKKLVKNESEKILGLSIPKIEKVAKQIDETTSKLYFNEGDRYYIEENILYCKLLNIYIKDYNELYLYLDNLVFNLYSWLDVDTCKLKLFKNAKGKEKEIIHNKLIDYLKCDQIYVNRFAIVNLLSYYMTDDYYKNDIYLLKQYKNNDYYIQMAISWYISVGIVKDYEFFITILENKLFDKNIHNIAINKCIDSFRIEEEKKKYIKELKIK